MGQIFISYSRRDKETVDHIVEAMGNTGLDVWIDREDIKAGNQWRVQIVEAIDTCDAFVLMLSPNSAASDNVRREIDLAQDPKLKIFAIMLEPVKLPAEIRNQLAGLQFIDVPKLGFEKAVSQLIDTVNRHVAELKPVEEEKTRQAELVIQGVDLKALGADQQEQLLDLVAQSTHASRSELKIANITAGSVIVDLPARPAYELKTLALNRDKRFKKFGIAALRLVGDAKFVNISLGILTASATLGFFQSLSLSMPSLLPVIVGIIAVGALVILGLPKPKPPAPIVILTPTSTPTLASTLTQTLTPNLTFTSTPTATLALTPTQASNPTLTPTIDGGPTTAVTTTAPNDVTATPLAPQKCTVNVSNALNLREGPGLQYTVVAWSMSGEVLTLTGTQPRNGWVEVRTADNVTGWINSNYCTLLE